MTLSNSYHHSWCINDISRSSWSTIIYRWCESLLYWSITSFIKYDAKSISPNIRVSLRVVRISRICFIGYILPEKRSLIFMFRILKIRQKLTLVTILSETIGKEGLILRIYRITIVEITSNRRVSISLPTEILITKSTGESSSSQESIHAITFCES